MKKRKSRRAQHRDQAIAQLPERGFDFGQRMRVMALSDMNFNELLVDAGIIGCAYGFDIHPDYKHPLPALTLVATDVEKVREAFTQFSAWGAESEGDVVEVTLVLQSDGRYQLWIGPELKRALHRLIPHMDLYEPLIMGVSWIKQIDSTSEMVYQLQTYLKTQRLAPVVLAAAYGDPTVGPSSLQTIDVPKVLKFDLQIVTEEEHKRRMHPGGKDEGPGNSSSPEDLRMYRSKVLSIAFPVTSERIRRQRIPERTRQLPGCSDVSADQVVQAAANLLLSDELNAGDRHFGMLGSKYSEQIWEYVSKRLELAGGQALPNWLNEQIVAKQIELDVRHVLRGKGVPVASEKFKKLQALFLRKGYAAD